MIRKCFYFWSCVLSAMSINCTSMCADKVVQEGKGYRFDADGWIYLHIEGEGRERGLQHGVLLAKEIKEELRILKQATYWNNGMEWGFFVKAAEDQFTDKIDEEYLEEIKGIAEGAKSAGTEVSWQEILLINGYEEIIYSWWTSMKGEISAKGMKEHCSAFIATGSMTKDGGIVVAHNTWDEFDQGQMCNVILDIKPAKGHRVLMQAGPGYIDSLADFVVTDVGLMCTETTIGGFNGYDPKGTPEFFRARKAAQYSENLDDFVRIMLDHNNGGYANIWFLGDSKSGEIMQFELGLKYNSIQRKKDGYYIGFNAASDPRIRNLECSDSGYEDIRNSHGARRVRLTDLMEANKGGIDVETARKVIADHFDVYLKKDNPCLRTIDSHNELDPMDYPGSSSPPFMPSGAVDGKVMDSRMAKDMSFSARWGSSCGMPFDAGKFLSEHRQYDYLKGYLKDRPSQPWSLFKSGMK